MSEQRQTLLVIEDDRGIQKQMRWALDDYELVFAEDCDQAIAALRRCEPAVVTLDLGLPPVPDSTQIGFATLAAIRAQAPDTKVVVVTGQNDRGNAVKAIAMGATDFFEKPFDPATLSLVIARTFRVADLERENQRLRAMQGTEFIEGMLTQDPATLKVCRLIERVAPTQGTVLLYGESGTGKELLAKALHARSPRRAKRFVAINCAAIPDALLESELFGHEKGAFTGAVRTTPGKIELAEGGTLFLDEIGDLPMSLQPKLLRFLQQRTVERVGGRDEISVDVRIVCATHRNLKDRIAEGMFREDLFYRLSELVIEIPPLRARSGDAALLAHAFVERVAKTNGRGNMTLSESAIESIERHPWPGNVRELENVVKRAVIMAEGTTIDADDLGLESGDGAQWLNLRQVREDAERHAVLRAMARYDGNIVRASEALGISRPTLYDLLSRLGLR